MKLPSSITATQRTLAAPIELPPPGSSPFRCKGLVYLGAKEFYAKKIPDPEGGAQWIADGHLRAFWNQHFLASTWVDALPIVALSRAAARVSNVPHNALVRDNARFVAERDIQGVYRLLLRVASAGMVAARLPKAFLQYFNFGKIGEQTSESKSSEVVLSEIPEPLAGWLCVCFEGFIPTALTMSGASDALVRCENLGIDGSKDRIPTCSLRIHMRWR